MEQKEPFFGNTYSWLKTLSRFWGQFSLQLSSKMTAEVYFRRYAPVLQGAC
jgi:hypothetical protein